MKQLTLIDLIQQVNEGSSELDNNIQTLRNAPNLAIEIKGFIEFYDLYDGDLQKLRTQIELNKKHILFPLKEVKKQPFYISKIIRYAAVFVVLISIGILSFLYFETEKIELSEIYKDPGMPTYMSNCSENELETVMFYFRKNKFNKANTFIQPLYLQNPSNDTIVYYCALIEHLNQNNQKAINLFQKLTFKENIFFEKAHYFLAICYLEQEKFSEALQEFEVVINLNDETLRAFAIKNKQEIKSFLATQK
jgi:hypothetical protein